MGIYCIDGKFLEKDIGGQARFGKEILKELDLLANKNEFEVVIPIDTKDVPVYQNIKVVKYGKNNGFLWEQLDFLKYIKKYKKKAIYLCTTWPFSRPDIAAIHDAAVFALPNIYNNLYGRLSVIYHQILFKVAAKKSDIILTVSNFSKSEIIKYLGVNEDKIKIIGNGWQHIQDVSCDMKIFEKFPQLQKGKYFLSASSLTPQKNFIWVKKAAQYNKNEFFAIAGSKVNLTTDSNYNENNLLYLGRVTDGEMKALMENCKAFIHPAKYEGFGITPMEAMSVGAPIIISNVACLPEIYGNSAHYIDPNVPDVDLNIILNEKVEPSKNVLDNYSWKKSAENFINVIRALK